jgi:hypothetical protein
MRVEWLAAVALLLTCAGEAVAREKPDTPSAEMLEFLGTYETADKKGFDPMDLKGAAVKKKETMKTKSGYANVKQGKTKKRELGYE